MAAVTIRKVSIGLIPLQIHKQTQSQKTKLVRPMFVIITDHTKLGGPAREVDRIEIEG